MVPKEKLIPTGPISVPVLLLKGPAAGGRRELQAGIASRLLYSPFSCIEAQFSCIEALRELFQGVGF